jgi:hypothetical protein
MRSFDVGQMQEERTRKQVLRTVNLVTREAIREMLETLPKGQRERLRRRIERARREACIAVDPEYRSSVYHPNDRNQFLQGLPPEEHMKYNLAMSKAIERLADELGLPALKEVEVIRRSQLMSLSQVHTDDDMHAVSRSSNLNTAEALKKYHANRLSSSRPE